MISEPGLVFSVIGVSLSIISLLLSMRTRERAELKELEHRLTMLEVKIDPIWKAVTEIIPKALMQDRTPELDGLLGKAINGYRSMTAEEKHRLNFLLDCEFIWALEAGNKTRMKRITIYQASISNISPTQP